MPSFSTDLEVKFDFINFHYGNFYFGYLVELFFVISGICAYRWIDQIQSGDVSFVRFYIKRVSRLLPLMAISIIANTIFMNIYHLAFKEWYSGIVPTIKGVIFACLGMQDG